VNDEKHNSRCDAPHRVPTILTFGGWVAFRQHVWVVENKSRGLEADIMLQEVPPVLVVIPFATHGLILRNMRID